MRMRDVTGEVPSRRMSVASGRAVGVGEPGTEQVVAAKVAAVQAAKAASLLLPSMAPFQATDAFCDVECTAGEARVTMTVQGYARALLASAAMAGVMAALLTLLESAGHPAGSRVLDVAVVQNVVD